MSGTDDKEGGAPEGKKPDAAAGAGAETGAGVRPGAGAAAGTGAGTGGGTGAGTGTGTGVRPGARAAAGAGAGEAGGPPSSQAAPRGGAATAHVPLDPEKVLAECDEEFVRAGGPGGQHRNRRETGVRLTHRPSGTVVMATERRSQSQNRHLALERLVAKLEAKRKPRKRRKRTRKGRGVLARERKERARLKDKKSVRGRVDPE